MEHLVVEIDITMVKRGELFGTGVTRVLIMITAIHDNDIHHYAK